MEMFYQNNAWVFVLITIWVLPWKGYALWTASKNGQKWWFIALLLINTVAILDIYYIFFVAKKSWKDIKDLFYSPIKK